MSKNNIFKQLGVNISISFYNYTSSVGHLTCKSEVLGSIPGLATYFSFSLRWFKRDSGQLLAKYVHEVLVNRLGGLSLPRKSVVRLTDRPDMTLDVYRGRKTTTIIQPYKYICW